MPVAPLCAIAATPINAIKTEGIRIFLAIELVL
jgi:hypothetical protein